MTIPLDSMMPDFCRVQRHNGIAFLGWKAECHEPGCLKRRGGVPYGAIPARTVRAAVSNLLRQHHSAHPEWLPRPQA